MIFIKAENAVDLRHQLITMFPEFRASKAVDKYVVDEDSMLRLKKGARTAVIKTDWAANEVTIDIPHDCRGMDIKICYKR